MSEIKPCPFCGVNEWKYQMHFSGVTIYQCEKCGTIVEEWVINTRPIEDALTARIAELEGKFDQLTARWRQERQDDKSSNDTQTQTIHGEDVCPKCHGTRLIGYDDCSGADCQDCGYFISEDEMRRRNESKI